MRKLTLLLLLAATCLAVQAQTSAKPITLSDVLTGTFRADGMRSLTPMSDGEHYTQLSPDGTKIIRYAFRTGEQTDVLFDATTARDATFKRIDGYTFSPDEKTILLRTETQSRYRHSYTAVHYLYSIKNNKVEPLSDGGAQEVPVFSPDGTMIAFVRDYNIYLVKLLFGNSESQVTEDGKFNEVMNGIPDWVNEEEFGYNRAFEFSSDSQLLAYVKFDEREVPLFSFQLFAGAAPRLEQYALYPGYYSYKYPKAGEKNSRVSVHTFDVKSRVTRQMDLPLEADGYVPRIRFTGETNQLAIMTLNRHQNRFDLYFADPRSRTCRLILRDESPYYINESVFDQIKFYPKNFSLISERDGFSHLYWYGMDGKLVKQVTKGTFEVSRFIGWDAATNTFYYQSNEGSPLRSAVYKIDRKGVKTNLTPKAGINRATFSSHLKYFIHMHTDLQTPSSYAICDNNGKTLKTLITNDALKARMQEYAMPVKEFFTFRTSQGVELNGWMMKPADFSPAKKYPVIMTQYSGPGSQRVQDSWSVSWETMMASDGYVVVCVDGRGTGGRGAEFCKTTYLNLGVKEAEDQVEAAKYLGSLPYINKDAIGIWGWSYGGYNTIMSMTEGTPVFKAGVAVAPVTDWKYYDTVYAERFMRTPQENAEGYRAGSAFSRVNNLNGSLLLVHGTADDNVHLQNTIEFSEALVQANRSFDMHIYTNRDHGIRGGQTSRHLYTMLTNYFNRHLR
ncbi:MAG: DPP IV N-terminal domain-containing protein [Prevotellaceae bacterium]|jgi:dipeptidyl-peptidase-4|nr:DPP IV N-terminal domain-containing protein [Prevotellaceae bacterium]